jgi:hypothetical protein
VAHPTSFGDWLGNRRMHGLLPLSGRTYEVPAMANRQRAAP